jgi:hypothetical protein
VPDVQYLPAPAPSSDTDRTGNLAGPAIDCTPYPVAESRNCARTRTSTCAPTGELVVIRFPAVTKSIVSDRTNSTRRRPGHATRHSLLSVPLKG